MFIKTGASPGAHYYIYKDHLGSITALTNSSTTIVEQYAYDPWGRRRNPVDWSFNNVPVPSLIHRGFTGHEHIDEMTLINMNGRIYDPALGMFISCDNFVQSPTQSQNFNRYSYCINNPLRYVDPDGEWVWLIPVIIGGVINTVSHWEDISSADNFWDGLGKAAGVFVAGGVNGYLTAFGGPLGTFAGGFLETMGTGLVLGKTENLFVKSMVSGGAQYLGGIIADKVSVLTNKGLANIGIESKLAKNILSDITGAIPGGFVAKTMNSYWGDDKSFKESLTEGFNSIPESVLSGISSGITKSLSVRQRASNIKKIRQNPALIDPYYDFQWTPSINKTYFPISPSFITPSIPSQDFIRFLYPNLYYPCH